MILPADNNEVLGCLRTKTAVPTRAWGEVGVEVAAAAGRGCCCWVLELGLLCRSAGGDVIFGDFWVTRV